MQTITKRPFGTCTLGDIDCITLDNGKGMTVEVITLGATLRSVTLPNQNGTPTDVALGYDSPTQYLAEKAYAGGCIGRYANRIGYSKFTLNGTEYHVTANQDNTHHLHGGNGYDKRLWQCDIQEHGAVFTLQDKHMEDGYPGNVDVSVTFALTDDNRLDITYQGQCDATTILNMTHHPYFNLNGHDSGSVGEQYLRINADFYTPADDAGIPTGEILQVAGTPVDVSTTAQLSTYIQNPALTVTRGLDHSFVLPCTNGAPFAWAWSKDSGIGMEISSTQPGVQAYTAGFFGDQVGKGGAQYHNHCGFALEPQIFPNAPNFAHFPSPVITPETPYIQTISYQFYSQVNW